MKKAVIYCRVSSERQVREGNGLEGQEKRCRDYANFKEYQVAQVFRDEGVSGGIIERPGIEALLDYITLHGGGYAVIVDDINRFARDVVAHFTLKEAIKQSNSELECVNMKLEDNPEGHFIETIMAASAELERNRNKRQVLSRMKARLELGYWVFDAPPGYKYIKNPVEGKILALDEPKASIIREAMEGFAIGRFQTQLDVQAFLAKKRFVHKGKFKVVHLEQVKRILTRSLYAGLIVYPEWDIRKPVQGKHEAIIPVATFNKIQEKLTGKAKQAFNRNALHEDFPMRGFALCAVCEKPLTASWSRGRTKKYPYYRCNNKSCANTQKSISRAALESAFAQSLQHVTPAKQIINLTKAITIGVYNKKLKEINSIVGQQEKELQELEQHIHQATDKLISTNNQTVQRALENKIEELELQKRRTRHSIKTLSHHDIDFGTALNTVMDFIENPHAMWAKGDLHQKRLVQKLVFMRPIVIDPSRAIGTAELSLPFKLLKDISSGKNKLVEAAGIEPASVSTLPSALHA